MAKCKCSAKARIVSDVVKSMNNNCGRCYDVCASPVYGDPGVLGIMAPLIYDEIGINLCTSFDLGVDIPAEYPTVTNASIKIINASYEYGAPNVVIESISARKNCYVVTLSNITVQFAVSLYDASCRLVDTVYPTAVYLPSDTSAATYDEDTNPSSVELEIFAPYGLSYTAGDTPSPIINFIGSDTVNNRITQGVNLFALSKLIAFSSDDSTVTVGLTLVLQSLYYVGYKVNSAGKIEIPKGSIVTPEDTDCMRFVAGELLNLAIKPLDLGSPSYEEGLKNDECESICCRGCNSCNTCDNTESAADNTTVITQPPAAPEN